MKPLLMLILPLLVIASFDLNRLRGQYRLIGGPDSSQTAPANRCGDVLRFETSALTFNVSDVSIDGAQCRGGGNVTLVENPQSGLSGLVPFFRRENEDVGTFYGGSIDLRMVCGAKVLNPGRTFFIFLRPERDVEVEWASVVGQGNPLEELGMKYTFEGGKEYVIIERRWCLFERDTTKPVDLGGRVCFPGEAMVQVEDGRRVRMRDLKTGKRVLVEGGRYEEVFMWSHRKGRGVYSFLEIDLGLETALVLTPSHYVYVGDGVLVRADEVRIGDVMRGGEGERLVVKGVKVVRRSGLYNPHTGGSIVVNGVLVSTYTGAVQPRAAHALLTPVRALWEVGLDFGDGLLKAVESVVE